MSTGSLELRAGILHSCQCNRRDGLQDFCPRSECGGPACKAEPVPLCAPANNGKSSRRRHAGPTATSTPPNLIAARGLPVKNNGREKFLAMGREGYIDNPPLPAYTFKPCSVHSQPTF